MNQPILRNQIGSIASTPSSPACCQNPAQAYRAQPLPSMGAGDSKAITESMAEQKKRTVLLAAIY